MVTSLERHVVPYTIPGHRDPVSGEHIDAKIVDFEDGWWLVRTDEGLEALATTPDGAAVMIGKMRAHRARSKR